MTQLIPTGLASMRIDGVSYRIQALSPERFAVLCADEPPFPTEVCFCFYSFARAAYQEVPLTGLTLLSHETLPYAHRLQFSAEDAAYRQAVLALCRDYAHYARLMQAGEVPQTLVGYPQSQDEDFPKSLEDAECEWLSPLNFSLDTPFELAMTLDRPSLYRRFLATDAQTLFDELLREHHLNHALFHRAVRRVYVGSSLCHNRVPDLGLFSQLIHRAQSQALAVTAVYPYLRPAHTSDFLSLLSMLCENGCELVVNDWGVLQLCREHNRPMSLCMGPLLNRRRRDPRLHYQNGYAQKSASLSENALNDPTYLCFLREQGFTRFEHESCGYPITLPPGRHSLHLPWYQTNTSQYCPLHALYSQGDRGKQTEVCSCDYPCDRMILGYAKHLKLVGEGNSLRALDTQVLQTPSRISDALRQGVDRLVVNWA